MSEGRLGASDCERIRLARLAQPMNAVTSVAYCAAGWAVAARCRGQAPERGRQVVAYAAVLGLVGVASVAFHGPQPRGSGVLHDWSISAQLVLVAASPLARQLRGRPALPGWTRARGARLAATGAMAGAAYAAGRTGSPACHPDGRIQLHGVWHLLSAAAFVQVADILYAGPVG